MWKHELTERCPFCYCEIQQIDMEVLSDLRFCSAEREVYFMKKKVVVGMSGGVDSSVAAWLLMQQGYEVIGVTMCHFDGMEDTLADAKSVADKLGISWQAADFREEFRREVMDYFVEEYLQGRTPNPCVMCNRHIKWQALLDYAKKQGADLIATGHYARIIRLANGRLAVANSVTAAKDQTYALYQLTQEQLSHTLMPVGEFPKEEVRAMAERAGLPVAHKRDSQEICFIPDHDYAAFIQKALEEAGRKSAAAEPGNFVDKEGKVLGQHKGIIHHTIGQRKGLNLAMGHPVFVTQIRPQTNEVVIGESEELFTTRLICDNVNLMAEERLEGPRRVLGKIRYGHKGTPCTISMEGTDRILCEFEEPVRAITAGQSAVFYEGDHVFGGGVICG